MENKGNWSSLPLSTKLKYISIILIAVLFTVFITQNLETVELDVFFWTFNVSFIVALIICFLVGVILTYIWMKITFSRKLKEKAEIKKKDNSEIE